MASSYLKKISHHHDQEGTWYHFPIYRVMISTFFDDVMPGCFDIICSLPTENKLWNHPILMICMIRRQVAFEQIITTAKGFSNSCPSVESVSFHQSSSLDCMPFINNASRQFFLNKWSFPLIFISTIRQIFSLSPLLLCVFDVKSFEVFKQSNYSFRLQPHSPIEVASKIWISITPFSGVMTDLHCLVSLCTTCVQTMSCFLSFTVVSPKENAYPLGSRLTNRNLPHPQKPSRNDFHGPLG